MALLCYSVTASLPTTSYCCCWSRWQASVGRRWWCWRWSAKKRTAERSMLMLLLLLLLSSSVIVIAAAVDCYCSTCATSGDSDWTDCRSVHPHPLHFVLHAGGDLFGHPLLLSGHPQRDHRHRGEALDRRWAGRRSRASTRAAACRRDWRGRRGLLPRGGDGGDRRRRHCFHHFLPDDRCGDQHHRHRRRPHRLRTTKARKGRKSGAEDSKVVLK